MEVCLLILAKKLKQDNTPKEETQNEKTGEDPFVNLGEENVKKDESMEKMKGFLNLLLKEIDKELALDSKNKNS
jgi:hypothetical protein